MLLKVTQRLTKVFPEPVCACRTHESPEVSGTMADCWIGVGSFIPSLRKEFDNGDENLTPANETLKSITLSTLLFSNINSESFMLPKRNLLHLINS
jgi:hypothetical protein